MQSQQPLTFAQAIQLDLDHHRAGRLQDAESIYRQILQHDPNNVDAIHLLGLLAHQTGHQDAAEQMLNRAIALGAGAEAYNNLGSVWRARGDMDRAFAAYNKASELRPNLPEPQTNLGLLLHNAGRFDEALVHHRRALELNPNLVDAQHNLAMTLDRMGKADEATNAWEKALDLNPDHAGALLKFGAALARAGGTSADRAVTLLRRYTQLVSRDAEGFTNLSTALRAASRMDEALVAANKAIELAPERAEVYSNLGILLQKMDRYAEAVEALDRALQINPESGFDHGNLASVYEQMDRHDDSAREFETAAKLLPGFAHVHNTLSSLYRNMNRDAEALAAADRAMTIDPDHPDAHGNRAFALLSLGNLQDGFYEYEWRWRCKHFTTPMREFDRPMWDGSDPRGRTILVHTEQGFGDVIQMARYLPMVADLGARIYIECFAPLKPLMENVRGVTRVMVAGIKLPDFDLHCPVMSLPRAFRTTLETIPNQVPYLTAPQRKREIWKPRIEQAARGRRWRVGLMWGGNKKPDPKRSCDLKLLAPLAVAGNDVSFISFQTGEHADQLREAPPELDIVHIGNELKDFADTAAALENIDLLITIDTAIAHLGGAVGVKTWTMVPHSPDWRWLRDREDSPWYPTMRLFRQPRRNAWPDVIDRVAAALKAFVG